MKRFILVTSLAMYLAVAPSCAALGIDPIAGGSAIIAQTGQQLATQGLQWLINWAETAGITKETGEKRPLTADEFRLVCQQIGVAVDSVPGQTRQSFVAPSQETKALAADYLARH